MNEDIIRFLNEYAEFPSPQYAVLLRGKWGCGKTYFVKNWLAEFDKSNKLPANEQHRTETNICFTLWYERNLRYQISH